MTPKGAKTVALVRVGKTATNPAPNAASFRIVFLARTDAEAWRPVEVPVKTIPREREVPNDASPQPTGPAMEVAFELRRRGLASGDGLEIAAVIDQLTSLPELITTLMDLFNGSRFEPDAKAFQRYVGEHTGAALERAGFRFSYLDDGSGRLDAMRERLVALDQRRR
jgi:hypothetical protein